MRRRKFRAQGVSSPVVTIGWQIACLLVCLWHLDDGDAASAYEIAFDRRRSSLLSSSIGAPAGLRHGGPPLQVALRSFL
jgi:hypothetical protein